MLSIFINILQDRSARVFLIVGVLLLALGGGFAYLTHRARKAEKTAIEAQTNANRAESKAAGYEILLNSNTQAAEIERERVKADEQAVNSNVAQNSLDNSILRDSNSFSGNYDEARKRFCRNFPADSRCR